MRLGTLALLACALTYALASPAAAAPLHSDNVTLQTKLPEAAGAASANFSDDGNTMYVSTWKGLHIYDISDPVAPVPAGFLPLPHFENEDVDTGGGLVIISNDPSEGQGIIYVIDVSDPLLPKLLSATPNGDALESSADSNTGHIANCIQECKYLWLTGTAEGIAIYDLTDPAAPVFVKKIEMPKGFNSEGVLKQSGGFTHDVFVDSSGIAWVTGEDGTFGYTTTDPTNPRLQYRSDEKVFNSGNVGPISPETANDYPLDFLHHNSIRTGIQLAANPAPGPTATPTSTATATIPVPTIGETPTATATPAETSTPGPAVTPSPATPASVPAVGARPKRPSAKRLRRALVKCGDRTGCKVKARRAFRKQMQRYNRALAAWKASKRRVLRTTTGGLGDIVAITEEDYTRPGCQGQGSVQTWQIKPGTYNSDGSTKLDLLDTWTSELNGLETLTGRSPATVNCSAHWFDENGGVLAQGWYDQGVRFLDISSPRDIRQIGYWVTSGTFWAAYYAPNDPSIVYALDVTSGIDVLKLDRSKSLATRVAPVPKRWMSGVRFDGGIAHPTFGFACPRLLGLPGAPA